VAVDEGRILARTLLISPQMSGSQYVRRAPLVGRSGTTGGAQEEMQNELLFRTSHLTQVQSGRTLN